MYKKRNKIIPACYLSLIQDNKILLLRRFNTGFEDGNYSFVAGHVDASESFAEAMVREAKEEAGIVIQLSYLKMLHVMHRRARDYERVDIFFTANAWSGEIRNMEPHKCNDLSWHNLDKLPDNTITYIKVAIKHIQNNVYYSDYK